jgi:pyruvate formate lyase activating enzyme
MREAMLYQKLTAQEVQCHLCAHRCRILSGHRGICGVRENRAGHLYTLTYGKAVALHVDPIEKKHLFHVLPGTKALSLATAGCNFHCQFCQNVDISQLPPAGVEAVRSQEWSPNTIVQAAVQSGCQSIACTYTEPTIFFEYAYEIVMLAQQHGLKNVWVTNGYTTPEAIATIGPYLDAANIDLKGWSDRFHRAVLGATVAPVLETMKRMVEDGIWVEITTVVIPGYNDTVQELQEMARFLIQINPTIPCILPAFIRIIACAPSLPHRGRPWREQQILAEQKGSNISIWRISRVIQQKIPSVHSVARG